MALALLSAEFLTVLAMVVLIVVVPLVVVAVIAVVKGYIEHDAERRFDELEGGEDDEVPERDDRSR